MKISDIKLHLRSIECTRHKIELEVKPYCPECEKEYQKSLDGKTVEERLLNCSDVAHNFNLEDVNSDIPKLCLRLNDALEITKDLFTKEQVEELLRKQREICAEIFMNQELYNFQKANTAHTISTLKRDDILNAPSPLEGEKK